LLSYYDINLSLAISHIKLKISMKSYGTRGYYHISQFINYQYMLIINIARTV